MSTARFNTLQNAAGSVSIPVDTVVNGSAKAWVNFNGTGTVAIRQAFNVSSITDNGLGTYAINFAVAMTDANYALAGSCRQTDTTAFKSSSVAFDDLDTALTTTAANIKITSGSNTVGLDVDLITAVIFR